jgi:hypothetical protein
MVKQSFLLRIYLDQRMRKFETTSANSSLHRFEIGLTHASFPPGYDRLLSTHASGQLPLGDPRSATGCPDHSCSIHKPNDNRLVIKQGVNWTTAGCEFPRPPWEPWTSSLSDRAPSVEHHGEALFREGMAAGGPTDG